MRPRTLVVSATLLCHLAGPAAAWSPSPSPAPFQLTVDAIMRGPGITGYEPSALRFSGDSKDLFFEWQPRDEDEAATFVVPRAGGTPRRLTEDERRLAPKPSGRWDAARRRIVFEERGDIVLVDTVARTRRQLTRTKDAESDPRWARGGTHVSFTRGDGVWLVPASDAAGDVLVQLLHAGPPETDPKLTPSQEYVKARERELLGWVREAERRREREEERAEKSAPPRLDLAARQSVQDAVVAGDHVFVLVEEKAEGARSPDMPRYVTESSFTEVQSTRTRVGERQDRVRLAVVDVAARRTQWVDTSFAGPAPDAKPAPSPSPSASPSALAQQASRQDAYRTVSWSLPVVSADGRVAVAQARSADNKDRWVVALDPATGQARVLHHEHQDAWVRELPAGGYGDANLGLLPDGRTAWFLSEADGWMHLYAADAVAGEPARQLTSGRFEIDEARLTPSGRRFLLTSTEGDPSQRHLWTMSAEGGARTRLTHGVGAHEGVLSPDERTLAVLHSKANRPAEVFLADARPQAPLRQVTTSPSAEWLSYPWVEPRLVMVKARDGVDVPARLYTPEMVGKTRDPRRPAVVFIHGAGYLQNAHRYWSSYFREYMFHHLLAERGYVVLDVDYRGSAGYGRDWRTAIYRHMGGKDLEDAVDGARWLAAAQDVDPRHVGIYGGSYGGFITLMALFTSPDTFAAGAALRPVTDWAHYNHGYTSNILNVPQEDAEAYRRSSPIHFAEGLRAPLLILHGMVDDNVHFSDSVRLAQRLIELRKEDWELAAYPVEPHTFKEETSWADEYRRILKLFERHVRKAAD